MSTGVTPAGTGWRYFTPPTSMNALSATAGVGHGFRQHPISRLSAVLLSSTEIVMKLPISKILKTLGLALLTAKIVERIIDAWKKKTW